MKIETFVGQKGIKITEQEKKYVEGIIDELLDGVEHAVEWDSCSDLLSQAKVTVPSMFGDGKSYRDGDGTLVQPEYIRVCFGRSAGYDEAEWGPVYDRKKEGKPTLDMDSYSFKVYVCGHERGYHRKTVWRWTSVSKTQYTYGTELADLEVEDVLLGLLRCVRGWRRVDDWSLGRPL